MGAQLKVSQTVLISGVTLLVAHPAWAQQAVTPPADTTAPTIDKVLLPQMPVNGGVGGYGAAPLFSPFPRDGAVQPLSFQVPGLKPADEAPRAFSVKVGVDGEEKMSDNVYLTTKPAKSDFITSAGGSLGADVDTRRVKGGIKYDLAYDKYARYSDLDGFRQDGIGLFDAELLEQRLFIAGRASVSEQSISPAGPSGATGAGPRTSASNSVRVYSGSIAPRLQQRFGEWALAQVSYHHDEIRFENASQVTTPTTSSTLTAANLNDSKTDGGRLEMRGGEAFSRLLWDYTGDVDHDVSSARTYDQVSHTLGTEYRLSADFGLLATLGHDYLHSDSVDLNKYGGAFYNSGVHWTPSPATDVRVGIGRRYDKADWIALITYWLGSSTVVRLSEHAGVTTDSLATEQALNAIQRDSSGGFIDPFSGLVANPSSSLFARTNAIFYQRNTDAVIRHDETRDSFALTARIAEQQLLGGSTTLNSPAIAGAANSTSTTVMGAFFSWGHHLTPVLTSMATVSQFDTLASTVGRTVQRKGSLALNYDMNPTLLGTLGYSTAATFPATTGSIRENIIAAGLHKTF